MKTLSIDSRNWILFFMYWKNIFLSLFLLCVMKIDYYLTLEITFAFPLVFVFSFDFHFRYRKQIFRDSNENRFCFSCIYFCRYFFVWLLIWFSSLMKCFGFKLRKDSLILCLQVIDKILIIFSCLLIDGRISSQKNTNLWFSSVFSVHLVFNYFLSENVFYR